MIIQDWIYALLSACGMATNAQFGQNINYHRHLRAAPFLPLDTSDWPIRGVISVRRHPSILFARRHLVRRASFYFLALTYAIASASSYPCPLSHSR